MASNTIAGYCRISFDDELDRDNTSIENQKDIIEDYVKNNFPNYRLELFVDRDRSGYTFEQREGYQKLRKKLFRHEIDILVIKDFSRFSRRNSRGLCELEDLRDAGIRIISINDGIDFPRNDDWLKIQFQFLLNEMPVVDTSKKIKSVIKRKQEEGQWICSAPYGYTITKDNKFEVIEEQAAVIKEIFRLYLTGLGIKKVAEEMTRRNIPTPLMSKTEGFERNGTVIQRKKPPKKEWNGTSISQIIHNDFYIGVFRQRKFTRTKINGDDIRLDVKNHIVFENHHEAIISKETFNAAQDAISDRCKKSYRGIKKFDNRYSGILFCGDCGSPMFARRRSENLREAYVCGNYMKFGNKACTNHRIWTDVMDDILKSYLEVINNNSLPILQDIDKSINGVKKNTKSIDSEKKAIENLKKRLEEEKEKIITLRKRRVLDIIKHPDQEDELNETYSLLESETSATIDGLNNQIAIIENNSEILNSAIEKITSSKDVIESILNNKLDKCVIKEIANKIVVNKDYIEIELSPNIENILKYISLSEGEKIINFNLDTIYSSKLKLEQLSDNRHPNVSKVYSVYVVKNGDPLETTSTLKQYDVQFAVSLIKLIKNLLKENDQ